MCRDLRAFAATRASLMRVGRDGEHLARMHFAEILDEVAHRNHCGRATVVADQWDVEEALEHHYDKHECNVRIGRQGEWIASHRRSDRRAREIDRVADDLHQDIALGENSGELAM